MVAFLASRAASNFFSGAFEYQGGNSGQRIRRDFNYVQQRFRPGRAASLLVTLPRPADVSSDLFFQNRRSQLNDVRFSVASILECGSGFGFTIGSPAG